MGLCGTKGATHPRRTLTTPKFFRIPLQVSLEFTQYYDLIRRGKLIEAGFRFKFPILHIPHARTHMYMRARLVYITWTMHVACISIYLSA